MAKFFSRRYGPEYVNYKKLPWYERDFMSLYDYVKYQGMAENPGNVFKSVKVINFDIINRECRGDPLK